MTSHQQNNDLFKVPPQEYGAQYAADYLSIYQDYVASAHAISERRHIANTFFLTANTGLLGLSGYLTSDGQGMIWLVALAAVLFSYAWLSLIASYRGLNQAKFAVITQLEERLPVAPYAAEWAQITEANHSHRELTRVESWVPRIFLLLHLVVFAFSIGTWLGL